MMKSHIKATDSNVSITCLGRGGEGRGRRGGVVVVVVVVVVVLLSSVHMEWIGLVE